jgi:hypothetical protein
MEAGAEIAFDVRTPVDDAGLTANVRASLARGLPEVTDHPWHRETLTVVAGGPTARNCPMDGPTLALNGALRLFVEQGRAPTYWAACDPQPIVSTFLTDAPAETTYLVCSKCHPSVFEALANRKVIVWHIDDHATWDLVKDRDPIRCGVSITIVAFELMGRFGFSRFETWGWDGCYVDGADHASPQPHVGVDRKTMIVGERTYPTNTSWALEAQDAVHKLTGDCPDLVIHGGGMMGAILNTFIPQIRIAA